MRFSVVSPKVTGRREPGRMAAATNDAQLSAAETYFDLPPAPGTLAIAREAVANADLIARPPN
jgi:hypothetical protein